MIDEFEGNFITGPPYQIDRRGGFVYLLSLLFIFEASVYHYLTIGIWAGMLKLPKAKLGILIAFVIRKIWPYNEGFKFY